MNLRMYCLWSVCSRFYEPVRDVSFIDNIDERILIQDFINACDKAKAWASIRRNNVSSDLVNRIKLALEFKHDFGLMIQLAGHMATDWEEWVEKRKLTQVKEKENRALIDNWSSKYKWNERANDVLLLAYMENLLALADKLDAYNLVEKILFQLEISLARTKVEHMKSYTNFLQHMDSLEKPVEFEDTVEYKLEICKIVTEIPLPSTYKLTKERWNKNKEYIESCESMKKVLSDLQIATLKGNVDDLRKAIDFGINYPSVKSTDIYKNAEEMLEVLTLK